MAELAHLDKNDCFHFFQNFSSRLFGGLQIENDLQSCSGFGCGPRHELQMWAVRLFRGRKQHEAVRILPEPAGHNATPELQVLLK